MTEPRTNPSPLAGEGAARQRRGAGEGEPSRVRKARALRSRMTDAERKLWLALRDRRFDAFKFRRQVPVGLYIVDFLCYDLRLVLEIDGGQHAEADRDVERDDWLARNNFRVMRYWNHDVLQNLEGVLTNLAEVLTKIPSPGVSPALDATLSREGRGKQEIAR